MIQKRPLPRRWWPLLALLISCAAGAGDSTGAAQPAPRPMPMNQPMPTKMAKPGMKTGDVKKAAERMDRRMKPMLEKEQKSMPGK